MLENDTLRFVDRETEKARLATYLFKYAEKLHFLCPNGEIGRRDRFKICFFGMWVRIPLEKLNDEMGERTLNPNGSLKQK